MPIVRVTFLAFLVTVPAAIRSPLPQLLPGASLHPSSFAEESVWDETLNQARDSGIDYFQLAQAALRGDPSALDRLLWFGTKTDAAGALGHGVVLVHILHELGDQRFAAALWKRPNREKRMLGAMLRAGLDYGPWRVAPQSLPDCFPMTEMATRSTTFVSSVPSEADS
jgi:hypothetical protein